MYIILEMYVDSLATFENMCLLILTLLINNIAI